MGLGELQGTRGGDVDLLAAGDDNALLFVSLGGFVWVCFGLVCLGDVPGQHRCRRGRWCFRVGSRRGEGSSLRSFRRARRIGLQR